MKLFDISDTELERDSKDDAPDTAKLFMNDDISTSTFEFCKEMVPPNVDAENPAKSVATILLRLALLRPPNRLIAAPERAEASQNLEPEIDKADPREASK